MTRTYVERDLQTKGDCVHSSTFGMVSLSKLVPSAVDAVIAKRPDDKRLDLRAYDNKPLDQELIDYATAHRDAVGVAYVYLMRQMAADREEIYAATDRYWLTCFRLAVFSRRLRPFKYFRACGREDEGVNLSIGQILGMPHHEEIARTVWKQNGPWEMRVEMVAGARRQLLKMESEYRNAAMAMAQIGIGIGGMYLGLIGLLLSFILTFASRH